jgi:hypothetical protein
VRHLDPSEYYRLQKVFINNKINRNKLIEILIEDDIPNQQIKAI